MLMDSVGSNKEFKQGTAWRLVSDTYLGLQMARLKCLGTKITPMSGSWKVNSYYSIGQSAYNCLLSMGWTSLQHDGVRVVKFLP